MSRGGVIGVYLVTHTHTHTHTHMDDRLKEAGYRFWEHTLTAKMDLESVQSQTACRTNCQSYYTAHKECNKYQLIKSN